MNERFIWFHILAGPVVYSVFFLAGYLVGEFGCQITTLQFSVSGLGAILWLVLALTVVAIVIIAVEIGLSYRFWNRHRHDEENRVFGNYGAFVGLAGVLLGVLFALVTAVTGLSVLFTEPCSWI